MKKQFLVLAGITTAIIVVAAISCKKNFNKDFQPRATQAGHLPSLPTKVLDQVISANKTLTPDTLWILDGKTYVTNGAILEINEGTTVAGVKRSADSASALIITRGSQIYATGNPDNPVVFTSAEGCPASGDWGGVVILGRSCLNRADTTIEGINLPSVPVGVDVNYGGGSACNCTNIVSTENDNSGVMQYVRIEYAGAVIAEGNELNGLTLGGVGAGTTLDHIEVAYGNDDGFEFFGGNVNASYLISLVSDDDAFDFDFGYNGSIQNAVAVLKNGTDVNGVAMNYSSSANGIESDNSNCADTCYVTRPHLSNLTIVGFEDATEAGSVSSGGLKNGAIFRTGSWQVMRNSVIMGYPTGVAFNCTQSVAGMPAFQYNTVHGFNTVDNPNGIDGTNTEISGAIANGSSINLIDPFNACNPNFRPSAGSPLLDPASVNYVGFPAYIQPKTYRGAFAGSGPDATWDREAWVKYNYERYCVECE